MGYHVGKPIESVVYCLNKPRGENDVIPLRSLTEDKRAFRRMLTSADPVTRSKRKLILIGLLSTLKGSLLLQELFDLLERKDWVLALPRGAKERII